MAPLRNQPIAARSVGPDVTLYRTVVKRSQNPSDSLEQLILQACLVKAGT